MSDTPVTTAQVTTSLRDLIALIGAYTVDEDGYVLQSNGERVVLGDPPQPLLVYMDPVPDAAALVVNPYAEGLGTTPASDWFYTGLRAGLLGRLAGAVEALLRLALEQKSEAGKKKKTDGAHLPAEVAGILAARVTGGKHPTSVEDEVDEAMLEEWRDFIAAHRARFVEIYYNRRQMHSVFQLPLLTDKQWVENDVTNIRKGTIKTLQVILRQLLRLGPDDDLSVFQCKPVPGAPAKLSTYLGTLFRVYERINPVLGHLLPHYEVDLGTLAIHLENLAAYTGRAKWMVQATPSTVPSTSPAMVTGTVVPTVPSASPQVAPAVPRTTGATGVSYIPGVQRVDGTQLPSTTQLPAVPQAAFANPWGQPMGMPGGMMMPGGYPMAGYTAPPPGMIGMGLAQPPMMAAQFTFAAPGYGAPAWPGVPGMPTGVY